MGMQDDIFDVQHALKGKPETEAFDRIYQRLVRAEIKWDKYSALLTKLCEGFGAIREIISEGVATPKRKRKTPCKK